MGQDQIVVTGSCILNDPDTPKEYYPNCKRVLDLLGQATGQLRIFHYMVTDPRFTDRGGYGDAVKPVLDECAAYLLAHRASEIDNG